MQSLLLSRIKAGEDDEGGAHGGKEMMMEAIYLDLPETYVDQGN